MPRPIQQLSDELRRQAREHPFNGCALTESVDGLRRRFDVELGLVVRVPHELTLLVVQWGQLTMHTAVPAQHGTFEAASVLRARRADDIASSGQLGCVGAVPPDLEATPGISSKHFLDQSMRAGSRHCPVEGITIAVGNDPLSQSRRAEPLGVVTRSGHADVQKPASIFPAHPSKTERRSRRIHHPQSIDIARRKRRLPCRPRVRFLPAACRVLVNSHPDEGSTSFLRNRCGGAA